MFSAMLRVLIFLLGLRIPVISDIQHYLMYVCRNFVKCLSHIVVMFLLTFQFTLQLLSSVFRKSPPCVFIVSWYLFQYFISSPSPTVSPGTPFPPSYGIHNCLLASKCRLFGCYVDGGRFRSSFILPYVKASILLFSSDCL